MIVGIISVFAFNLADTYFVGQLGGIELAALTFTFPVVSLLAALSLGLGMGVTSVVARVEGSGDRQRVRCLSTDALTLAVLIVLILSLIGLLTIEPLFELLGARGDTLVYIKRYMQIWYLGMPFIVVPMVGNGIIRGLGNFSFPMYVMIVAGLTNIVFDYLLIFGNFGLPKLDLEGAAIATVLSRAITFLASLYFLIYRQKTLCNPFTRSEVLKSWKYILQTALPSALMNTVNPISLAIITALIAGFGKDIVAGFGVGMRVESFAIIPLFAVSSALNPIIAQNYGAQNFKRTREAMNKGFLFAAFWGVLVVSFMAIFANEIVSEFNDDPRIIQAGVDFLHISPIVYIVEGVIMYVAVYFIAVGTSYKSMLISTFRFGVFYIPLAWLGGRLYGYQGIFAGKVISGYLSAIQSYWWWRRDRK